MRPKSLKAKAFETADGLTTALPKGRRIYIYIERDIDIDICALFSNYSMLYNMYIYYKLYLKLYKVGVAAMLAPKFPAQVLHRL